MCVCVCVRGNEMLVTKLFPCTRGLTGTQIAFPNNTDYFCFFFSYILFVVHSSGQRATLDPFRHRALTSQARLLCVSEHILPDCFLPGAKRWQDWPNLFSAFVVFRVSSDDCERFSCHIKEYMIKVWKKWIKTNTMPSTTKINGDFTCNLQTAN